MSVGPQYFKMLLITIIIYISIVPHDLGGWGMIVTMRSLAEIEAGQGRLLARDSLRRWCLAFGLEALLLLLLLLLAWRVALPSSPPVMSPEAEAGTGDDLSVVLLMASGQPLRPARFAPAAAPSAATAVTKPVKPSAVSAPVALAARVVEPVSTAAATAVTPRIREASPAAAVEPVAVPNAAPAVAATDAGGTGSTAGQTSTTAAVGSSGQPPANASATGSSQGSGSGLGSHHARHPYFGKLKTWLNAHKTYPAALKKAKTQGTVVLTFTISRRGELLSSRIVTGSGEPGLDQAALEMLQRSSPMPPLPDDLGLDQLTLTIPVEYSLITR